MFVLRNGYYLPPAGSFVEGDIAIDNGKIISVGPVPAAEGNIENIDLQGLRVIPGLVDIHTHGALGYDVMAASPMELKEVAGFIGRNGVTSFLPTTITSEIKYVNKALENIKAASEIGDNGASIEGVHIEGPYINAKHKGCHETSWIKPADIKEYENFKSILGDKLKIRITVAPEIPGALEFIKHVSSRGDSITIGHTDADSNTVKEAVENGANSFTHLFNAMKGIHHREPGTVGAALSGEAFVELICDGIHVHPDVIKMVYKIKGADKILLVTDAMHATGLGDGDYLFGGLKIKVTGGIARTEDGALAGSTLILWNAVKNMMKFAGVSFEEAVRMATINPAKVIGIDNITGSIETGKRADLVVVDEAFDIKAVFCKGKRIYDAR